MSNPTTNSCLQIKAIDRNFEEQNTVENSQKNQLSGFYPLLEIRNKPPDLEEPKKL